MLSGFWDFLWLIIWSFFLISYLMVLFQIIIDMFLDNELGGFAKALWTIALLVLPMLTALAYILFRGGGMARRRREDARRSSEGAESYIRTVAGRSPATEIAEANALLRDGTISEAEFLRIKAKALA
ncbi:Phospholipase_D-nuclease N-terminal [Devosia sp. YR412]|uniref:PLDc N-terminal domain-containing protein n=1 Tax=Devosia sp. YR412 TaxID=1881030 RepID=UPI0008CD37DC|nr:PLDc N-terminal domain-containing protein [Devosia sp. YR412]SEQ41419.1 Phospholipase_D-nuclease N-terminal [Devosia sp. YR412]